MLPLPTSETLFVKAMWSYYGFDDEMIAELLSDRAESECSAKLEVALMLQGGAAGVALTSEGVVVSFGKCEVVQKLYELAKDVYDFPYTSEEALCQKFFL